MAKRDPPAGALRGQVFRGRCGCCRNAPSLAPHGFPGNVAALRQNPGRARGAGTAWGMGEGSDASGEGDRSRHMGSTCRPDVEDASMIPGGPLCGNTTQLALTTLCGHRRKRKAAVRDADANSSEYGSARGGSRHCVAQSSTNTVSHSCSEELHEIARFDQRLEF